MSEELAPDICVIGAGPGGLAAAAGAAMLGASVVLIEKGSMGGDNLSHGSVPSKALLAAARRAQAMRGTKPFGITPTVPTVNHRVVLEHIQGVIAAAQPNVSADRLAGLGVRVVNAAARFADKTSVLAGDLRITARRFVVATGSSPALPALPGLDKVPYFTTETILQNGSRLDHLVVIGAGAAGLELAQAHLRLGSRVTVVDAAKALALDDPELTAPLLERLRSEGVLLAEGVQIDAIEPREGGIRVEVSSGADRETLDASHLLLAVGRTPRVDGLGLEAAGVKFDRHGIKVSRRLRTSNPRIYAIGDVLGGPGHANTAVHQAQVVIQQALFRVSRGFDQASATHVIFTDPELAQAGLTEDAARARHGRRIRVLRWPMAENDRALAEHQEKGFVKVVTTPSGRILGATILGENAGELIHVWSLAISQGLGIRAMTNYIPPYPTLGEVNRQAGLSFASGRLTNPFIRHAVKLLSRFG